jgi:hypothetical protein
MLRHAFYWRLSDPASDDLPVSRYLQGWGRRGDRAMRRCPPTVQTKRLNRSGSASEITVLAPLVTISFHLSQR